MIPLHQAAIYLWEHKATVLFAAAMAFSAVTVTMPEQRPKSLDDFWTWFRDASHQFGNAKIPK